ncbi:hypothetical protein [Metabacillus schmidteae]|uniref:hypothetical protein n=1 Tax=Metabacillus schmidteae TaxID=2730405 RepID=UPI001589780D|nr:hypothetical protein [Metabacillus schmidteae]
MFKKSIEQLLIMGSLVEQRIMCILVMMEKNIKPTQILKWKYTKMKSIKSVISQGPNT